ncbi:MAG: DUF2231 domain-containing protein [Acidimicrobiales bacterium]
MKTFLGLPAHPLFVHAPLVLVPLVALAAVTLALRPSWRRRCSTALAVAALVAMVATFLAMQSGEAFEPAVRDIVNLDTHKSLAQTTRLLVVVFFLGSAAAAALDRMRGDERPWADKAAQAVVAVTAVMGVAGSVWMARTGHEGARLVWDGVELMVRLGIPGR